MPRSSSSNIAHASITDHRIPRVLASARPTRRTPAAGTLPLTLFHTGSESRMDSERERDLGIALSNVLTSQSGNGDARSVRIVATLAEERLKAAVARWRGDLPAWTALSVARQVRGDVEGSLEAATVAVELSPESDIARANLVSALTAANRFSEGIAAATELIKMNPSAIEPLLLRADIYIRLKEWKKAEADCRAALKIQPLIPGTRLLLAVCRHHSGDAVGGRREADLAAGLTTSPRQRASILESYRAQTR